VKLHVLWFRLICRVRGHDIGPTLHTSALYPDKSYFWCRRCGVCFYVARTFSSTFTPTQERPS
jgi:hypothetical protein